MGDPEEKVPDDGKPADQNYIEHPQGKQLPYKGLNGHIVNNTNSGQIPASRNNQHSLVTSLTVCNVQAGCRVRGGCTSKYLCPELITKHSAKQ